MAARARRNPMDRNGCWINGLICAATDRSVHMFHSLSRPSRLALLGLAPEANAEEGALHSSQAGRRENGLQAGRGFDPAGDVLTGE
jgi:hypothetical protein